MRAFVTVIGKDVVGILSKVSSCCARHNANILEVTQTLLQDIFAMIMLIDITGMDVEISALEDEMNAIAGDMGLVIHVMHEDIFNSMHKI